MTTATADTKTPMPTHYQSLIEKALEMDWEVERNPSSIKIIPPKGVRVKSFSLSRTKPLVPPQLNKELKGNGFTDAYEAFKRGGSDETKAQAAKPEKEMLVCPECVKEGVEEPFSTVRPPTLGIHRRAKHGILGASSEAVRKRGVNAAKKAAAKQAAKKAPAKKAAPKEAKVPGPRPAVEAAPQASTTGLPDKVGALVTALVDTVRSELGNATGLQEEVQTLRDFRDKVDTLVHDGNQPPLKVVASILDLVEETKQK